MSNSQRNALVDTWMSPRITHLLLTCNAESIVDGCLDQLSSREVNRGEYIPPSILQSNAWKIGKGWAALWSTAAEVLRAGKTPTVANIKAHVCQSSDALDYSTFASVGGRIECLVDALTKITRNVVVDGDDGCVYEFLREDVGALSPNPLDGAFDLAFVQRIHHGGGEALSSRGPYYESIDFCSYNDDSVERYSDFE